MGNSQSSHHHALEPDRDTLMAPSSLGEIPDEPSLQTPTTTPADGPVRNRRQRTSFYGSLRHRVSHRIQPGRSRSGGLVQERDGEAEQENHPLVHQLDADPPTHPQTTTSTTLEPLPNVLSRSASSVSRLGSRVLPNSVARVLLSSGEETAAEGHALRNGTPERWRIVQRSSTVDNNSRFSLTGSIRRRMEYRAESRGDSRRHTARGPFPMGATHQQLLNDHDTLTTPRSTDSLDLSEATVSLRRRSRLQRVRRSLSTPLTNLFQLPQARPTSLRLDHPAVARSARHTSAQDSDHLLPNSVERRRDVEDTPHELDAVESETRSVLPGPTATSGMSTIRRIPHSLRSRSRLIRRQENPPLSQVLQLAAQAIATQLSGHASGAPTTRPFGGDTFGGSIQNFVHTLQEAASAQAGEDIDMNAPDGELPPVNFMRVFQFPNDENGSPVTAQERSATEAAEADFGDGISEAERSVTLVLVGVRSMPHSHETLGEHGALGPSLDNLLNLPLLPPSNMLGHGGSGALFRRAGGRARTHPRRHSMTNFDFPAQYESQRHHRPRGSTHGSFNDHATSFTPISESPPGPHPPPSTPADIRSGHATPIRRPSSASAAHGGLPDLDEDHPHPSLASSPESGHNTARQRRRSDSEFARRPELGSGAARRNGVVEPDNAPSGSGRSWLIYVVGTNVSADHPAFTMPSLFTDNPSYEDMQMLTNLLGPVKPPVASHEDVVSSGGLYRLVLQDNVLLAQPLFGEGNEAPINLRLGERCLICLCDYEAAEELRQLHKCQHVYHRECIDEWLTTGRNSCPMCRGQGVDERNPSSGPSDESPGADMAPASRTPQSVNVE